MSIKIPPLELEHDYRLLKAGEVIVQGDVMCLGDNNYALRTANTGIGAHYDYEIYCETYRKIKIENSIESNIVFFSYNTPELPFWAANKDYGHLFLSNGVSHSGPVPGWCIAGLKSYPEISQKEAFSMLNSKDAKKRAAKTLGIELNLNIPITDKQKEAILSKLQKCRAFNEDSAMEMTDIEICEQLAENKVIRSYENRFYLSK